MSLEDIVSSFEDMQLVDVQAALKQIERHYVVFNGAIDLIKMSNDQNVYASWKRLREAERRKIREVPGLPG